ncbi:hypothetical protein [Streptomyces cavernae]|uniref:hypothetical protein n=1 Tax=Streptomyces cavernae TaxID=2259034 RepID=UPI001EE3AD73|nr:hypothetical protein [Streptomyces cavernae]
MPVAFVGQDPVDTDDGTGGGDGTGDGGTGSGGGPGSGGSCGGGPVGTDPTATDGGSLASTGATVLGIAASAVLLTATGWVLHRRARVKYRAESAG